MAVVVAPKLDYGCRQPVDQRLQQYAREECHKHEEARRAAAHAINGVSAVLLWLVPCQTQLNVNTANTSYTLHDTADSGEPHAEPRDRWTRGSSTRQKRGETPRNCRICNVAAHHTRPADPKGVRLTCFRRRFSSSRSERAVSNSPVSFATRFCRKRGMIRLVPFAPTFAPHWGQLRLSCSDRVRGRMKTEAWCGKAFAT